jgi:hypothetical protein
VLARSLAALVLLWAAPLDAQPAAEPTVRDGRGFSWGGVAVVPVLIGDVRYVERPDPVPYYAPGAGVLGRIGWELPYGLGLYGTFSVRAFAVEAQAALQHYRGGLELRWTIDTGTVALPIATIGGTVDFLSRAGALGTTGGVFGAAGIAFAVAPWAELEIGLELSVVFPGVAFVDTVLCLTPSIGGVFFF